MRLLAALLLVAAAAPAQNVLKDPLLDALNEEINRSRGLRLMGVDMPYFISYNVDDAESYSVSASLGALISQHRTRLRPVRIQVRVGNQQLDNTNSVFSDFYSGARFDNERLPLDDQSYALRHSLWLITDRAYKTAVEAIARKRAALRGVTTSEPLEDFSPATPLRLLQETRRQKVDENLWQARVRALSALFRAYPQITGSSVSFEWVQGTSYLLSTENTALRLPDAALYLRVRAGLQAADGMRLHDGLGVQALEPGYWPAEAGLRQAVEGVARNLAALGAAPVGESYVGPVLFEPVASAQVFADVFAPHLAVPRRPVSDPGRSFPFAQSELEGRLGARVLPEWMDLTDDPTRKQWEGRPLLGFYEADLEGVAPKPLTLVEKGLLKNYLLTRQPVKGMSGSNGRARLPGALGVRTARFGNLEVVAGQTAPLGTLKQRLVELVKGQGKPYGMLVRKLDFPSAGSGDDLRRAMQRGGRGATRPGASPVLVYKVFPDGREELVRGLRFRNLNARAFRDILAASSERVLFDFLDNGAPAALMGAGSFIVGCSVVAPGVLFEELELERAEDDLPKPPLVPPPTAP